MSLVAKQWKEVSRHPDLKWEKMKDFMQLLKGYSKPYLLNSQPIQGSIIHHKRNRVTRWFVKDYFEINGKAYKIPNEAEKGWMKETKIFFVILQDNVLKLTEKEQPALFKLERNIVLLSTEHAVQSEYACLPVKWTLSPSTDNLKENEEDFVKRIKADKQLIEKSISDFS